MVENKCDDHLPLATGHKEQLHQSSQQIIETTTPNTTPPQSHAFRFSLQAIKFKKAFSWLAEEFTGSHTIVDGLRSPNDFVQFMMAPTDAASLGIVRMMFGLMMLLDIPQERSGAELDLRWGTPQDCRFPLFPFVRPLALPKMGLLYGIMWLGAVGITLGYKFRLACGMFVLPYIYIFLLDKSVWNNHSYLYGLLGILFWVSHANRYCSLDALFVKNQPGHAAVPFWNYFVIKYQLFILFFVAGLKKSSTEWLSGYAMTNLSYHWVFAPIRLFLDPDLADLLVIHWFGFIFDLSVVFLLIYERTRPIATLFSIGFHLMNSRLFTIGMFPWVCLVTLPLFYKTSWPRWLFHELMLLTTRTSVNQQKKSTKSEERCNIINEPIDLNYSKRYVESNKESRIDRKDEIPTGKTLDQLQASKETSRGSLLTKSSNGITSSTIVPLQKDGKEVSKCSTTPNRSTRKQKFIFLLIVFYCGVQAFLPYSHFITKGYNNWTGSGLYGYSWDMMIHAWDTILVSVKIIDNQNQLEHFLEPYAFSESDRWTKHADMAIQYAHCIHRNMVELSDRHNTIAVNNVSIYFDIWCSLNGRFQQRMFDPTVDLLDAPWSPFETVKWALPLLNEFNHMRPRIREITEHVLSWSNHSDVLFIADFPGFTMENYITDDLGNITLTILEGAVLYREEQNVQTISLRSGESASVMPGCFHRVTIISATPASYYYSFVNETMRESGLAYEDGREVTSYFSLTIEDEFRRIIDSYKRFFGHLTNSLLYELYGVPMQRRSREKRQVEG